MRWIYGKKGCSGSYIFPFRYLRFASYQGLYPQTGIILPIQQTPILLRKWSPYLQTKLPKSLMKISNSRHRFGLWWLYYLCLCCLQTTFLPFVEIFHYMWICCYLPLVCCVEGVVVTIGLGFGDCVISVYVAFRPPFYLLLRFFLSCESAVAYLSSAVWKE